MQKKRSGNRTSDAYKKKHFPAMVGLSAVQREKPMTAKEYADFLRSRKASPKKRSLPFDKKLSEIASLAVKRGSPLGTEAEHFVNLFKLRGMKEFLEREYSDPSERREALIRNVGEGHLKRELHGVNDWLEKLKRPELKLTFDEVIDMILK